MIRRSAIAAVSFACCQIASASWACFVTPDSRPPIGCMPFNFSAPLDWPGFSRGEGDRYPEVGCYMEASRLHTRLIARLYGQMLAGDPPDAFSPAPSAPDLNAGGSYDPRFDFNAIQVVKKFSPPFVRAYYPPLYAIVRNFEACMLKVAKAGCGGDPNCRLLGFVNMGYLPDGSQYPVVGLPEFDEEDACTPDMRVFLGDKMCDLLEAENIEGVLELRASAVNQIPINLRIEMPHAQLQLIQPKFWERVWVRTGELFVENAAKFDFRNDAIAFTAEAWAEIATRRFKTVSPDLYRGIAALVGGNLDIGPGQVDPARFSDAATAFIKIVYSEFLAHYVQKKLAGRFLAQGSLRLVLSSGGVAVVGTASTVAAGSAIGIVIAAIEDVIEEGPVPQVVPKTLIAQELGIAAQFCAGGGVRGAQDMLVPLPGGYVVSHVARTTCTAGFAAKGDEDLNPMCNAQGCLVRLIEVTQAADEKKKKNEAFRTVGQGYTVRAESSQGSGFSVASIEQAAKYTAHESGPAAAEEKRKLLYDFIAERNLRVLP